MQLNENETDAFELHLFSYLLSFFFGLLIKLIDVVVAASELQLLLLRTHNGIFRAVLKQTVRLKILVTPK